MQNFLQNLTETQTKRLSVRLIFIKLLHTKKS